ncbi:MAG: hypothetical protein QM831_02915 [Kofleriaceae bacterium]
MRSRLVYPMDWPAVSFLVARTGVYTGAKPVDPWGVPLEVHIPCAGSGPWHMDSVTKIYRDCSEPDLSKAASAPWIYATVRR